MAYAFGARPLSIRAKVNYISGKYWFFSLVVLNKKTNSWFQFSFIRQSFIWFIQTFIEGKCSNNNGVKWKAGFRIDSGVVPHQLYELIQAIYTILKSLVWLHTHSYTFGLIIQFGLIWKSKFFFILAIHMVGLDHSFGSYSSTDLLQFYGWFVRENVECTWCCQ